MKQNTRTILLAALFCTGLFSASAADNAIPTKPVDPQANSQTLAIYDFLYSNYGRQTITCSMAQPVWDTDNAQAVHTLTQQWPAMHCFDLMHLCYSPANWINYGDLTPVKHWHQQGGKVVLMWHWQVPKQQGSTEYTSTASLTTFSPANINTEGSWEHQQFYADLWEAYTVVRDLQEAGISVIWRPLHEAAGNVPNGGTAWFWWGKDGADTFKQLWRRIFDYFRDGGIHNVIWVWTSCDADSDWYPGDDYVDIVGTDSYKTDVATLKSRYQQLQERYPNRMLALTECGQVPAVSAQQQQGIYWSWAMPWYGSDDNNTPWVSDAWWQDAVSSYATGIHAAPAAAQPVPTAAWSLDGRPATGRGIRIVRMSDGTVRKVVH